MLEMAALGFVIFRESKIDTIKPSSQHNSIISAAAVAKWKVAPGFCILKMLLRLSAFNTSPFFLAANSGGSQVNKLWQRHCRKHNGPYLWSSDLRTSLTLINKTMATKTRLQRVHSEECLLPYNKGFKRKTPYRAINRALE